jgi:hypothetical protein
MVAMHGSVTPAEMAIPLILIRGDHQQAVAQPGR